MSKKPNRRGYTMVDETNERPLTTLDELPTASGLTCQEIEKTLEENKIVEQHIVWSEYLGDSLTENKHCVNIDILLPNGLLLPTLCPLEGSLAQLKQTVYKYIKKLPLGNEVKDISNYIFFVVSDDGELLELFDEERSLNAIQMFLPILALKEPKDNEFNKKMTKDISLLLGNDLEKMEKYALSDELRNFRIELFNACQVAEQERGTDGVLHYEFPEETILPNVGDRCFSPNSHSEVHEEDIEFWWFPNLPTDAHAQAMQRLRKKVERSKNGLEVWYSAVEGREYRESIGIKDIFEKTPSEIIKLSLLELGKDHENPADFILQVVGRRTFITRNLNIIRYEYIRSCFENYRQPLLLLRRKHAVFSEFARPPPIFQPFYVRADRFRKRFPCEKPEPRCFWDLDDNMRIRIKSVSNMEVTNVEKIYLRVAIAVGRHILGVKDSAKVSPTNPRWIGEDDMLEFDIYLKDLPESAQLSISLIYVMNSKVGLEEHAVAFINLRLFDWQNRFIRGKHTLYLWPFPVESDEKLMNLLGTQGQNHNTKTVRIEVEIYDDNICRDYEFPDWPMIERYADFVERNISSKKPVVELDRITRESAIFARILRLRTTLDGSKLSGNDQKFLWDVRFKIQELFPQMILILADCPLIYKEREILCEFYTLLNDWPQLYIDTALELLDVRFPDRYVRAFAVRHLDKCLDNDQLLIYLLPLVQALKYEPFSTCSLADVLIRRALMDYRIGHTFFWLLCSELALFKSEEVEVLEKAPKMYLRLCLMFEAYCRGNACHLDSMIKQKEMVNTLTELSKLVKSYALKELATKRLRSELTKIKDRMQNMHSPLNPCCRLGELVVEECRVLGSAKMPLKLRWKNPEPMCHLTNEFHHEIIFKNGDDLRQDLLTLQVMRIFDAKWKNYNLDYCLTLYAVLPMGQNIGMIHVVQTCHTIFQIQCSAKQLSSNFGIDQKLLNRYIYDVCTKDKELNSKQYMECVDRFSSSLAGYCIATYVLGIKDRHQDNLMLVEDGRIFHIDFGHILGHGKVKFGVNRERTEFVLTDHFLCVISHGKEDIKGTYMYKNFRDACLQGFMLLHYHRRFFIALFRMMRCMGLPELKKYEDFDYLYTSLMYDQTQRDVVDAAFLEIFDNVVKNDISTNVNWFFHTVRHHI